MDMTLIQKICIWILPVLFAIIFHEIAHGWVALKFGDKTALMLGRLSVNPLKHIDLIGTILVPGILLAVGGVIFGWAKPVPINARNFRHPRRDMAMVAVAGPLANLVMALIWALIMKLGVYLTKDATALAAPIIYMGQAGVFVNIMLLVINLIPIPPLDGGRFISNILPLRISYYFDKLESVGLLLLLLLLVTGILSKIFAPLLYGLLNIIFSLFGLGGN
ncbi:MAG: peptidase [Gammaproteobacteria bacterium RIFCSPHIGHO2_12_FULL_35_23]|nr:MAG: peptidase [Gammaproteobacteria bacterium RIFCSPHIGHO2_12_FULL_35_23]